MISSHDSSGTSVRQHGWIAVAASLCLAGCAATPSTLTNGATSGPGVSTAALNETVLAIGNTPTVDVSATELYSRVAAGALKCWFGAGGPLKRTHIFDAEAVPSGGRAEITIHERDTASGQASPRGIRAFKIEMAPITEGKSRLSMHAGKLEKDLAPALEQDVLAYAFGKESCQAQIVRPPPPPPEPKKPTRKTRAAAR